MKDGKTTMNLRDVLTYLRVATTSPNTLSETCIKLKPTADERLVLVHIYGTDINSAVMIIYNVFMELMLTGITVPVEHPLTKKKVQVNSAAQSYIKKLTSRYTSLIEAIKTGKGHNGNNEHQTEGNTVFTLDLNGIIERH